MTPVRFEAQYAELWRELERGLDALEGRALSTAAPTAAAGSDAARLAGLYRRSCEHLALAQARAYPMRLTQYLQGLTYRAHRHIYRRQDYGAARLRQLVLVDIPQCVRRHRRYLLAAVLLFAVPMLLVGWATYRNPGFALRVMSASDLGMFRQMYSGGGELGRLRNAGGDWSMFGFYILNNISIAFQCFATGIFACVVSAYFLAFNGVYSGAVGGYLAQEGLGTNFFSFVVTHSAFELTAICIAGAAGLRIGHALVVPGRRTRLESLRVAARPSGPPPPGWRRASSSRPVPPPGPWSSPISCGRGARPPAPRPGETRVEVDALCIRLRPRTMTEAADLGVRMVQAHARSVWTSMLPAYGASVALALATLPIAPWLPLLLLFWLKPWIDRSLLFALSRAVFGQATTLPDLWRARGVLLDGGLLAVLTRQRLSPWRSFTQPIDQLEGLRGAQRRVRRRVLLRGQRGQAALAQLAFGNVEFAFLAGLLALTAWFSPTGHHTDALGWLARNKGDTLGAAIDAASYAAVVLVVEPYYAAAGFAMYLNRRVQLEAWDVEQEFRRAFA
jgi:uncharacterized membrane protein SpoIIM required for sporulation